MRPFEATMLDMALANGFPWYSVLRPSAFSINKIPAAT